MLSGNQVPFEASAGLTRKNSWWWLKTVPCGGISVSMATSRPFLWEMLVFEHCLNSLLDANALKKGGRRIWRESLPFLDIRLCRIAFQ